MGWPRLPQHQRGPDGHNELRNVAVSNDEALVAVVTHRNSTMAAVGHYALIDAAMVKHAYGDIPKRRSKLRRRYC